MSTPPSPFAPNVVALVSDKGLFPAAYFLASRLAELNPRNDTYIHLFTDSTADFAKAQALQPRFAVRLIASLSVLPNAQDRISGAAFFRLYLPEMFPPGAARRILYVDVDTYPESDALFSLFDTDMRGFAIAAVRDQWMTFAGTTEAARERGHAGNAKYLNSGALLIDRETYRQQNLKLRILSAVSEVGLHDQAAINRVLAGNWLELPPTMNLNYSVRNHPVGANTGPALLHFMGKIKPWHANFDPEHEARRALESFLATTPWPNFVQPANGEPEMVPLPAETDVAALGGFLADWASRSGS